MSALLRSQWPAGDGIHLGADELIALRGRCRALFLPGRQPARSALAGPHHSRFRGRGVDYLESRNYLPGDDIRNMDWRVTARTGRPHTKVFQEERERPIMVAVDRNPGMFFGTRTRLKSVQAAYLAAALGWIAVQRGDRIGGVIFGGGVHHELRPSGGRRGVMRLVQQLVRLCQPGEENGTDPLGETLQRMRNVVRPGSLLVIISDFFSLNGNADRHLSRLSQHNDVIGCQVLDPAEMDLPAGRYPITDGRQDGVLDTINNKSRQRFESLAADHQQQPRQLFLRYNCRWLSVATPDDPVDHLGRALRGFNAR